MKGGVLNDFSKQAFLAPSQPDMIIDYIKCNVLVSVSLNIGKMY
jgi:hypothetical protein